MAFLNILLPLVRPHPFFCFCQQDSAAQASIDKCCPLFMMLMHRTGSHVAQIIASSDVLIRHICMLLQLKIKALLTGAMHCTASLLFGCP